VTSPRRIVIGVDTHLDTIHVAAITDTGQVLGDAEFGTDPTGYYVALRWAQSFGDVLTAGVEGTSSYGAGFTQALQDNDIHVVEVTRPDRAARRRQGKSDPLDAYSAARAVLAGHGVAVPKDPHTQALKALLVARRGAVKARSAAIQQIKDLLVTAPADLRERYRRYPTTLKLVQALTRCRPCAHTDPATIAVLLACKALAQRIEFLERQTNDLTAELDTLSTALNPALRAAYGVGPTPPPNCSSPPAPTPIDCAAKPHSQSSAVSPPSRPHPGKPPDTGSAAAATVPPTTRCTASPWSAGHTTHAPATTPSANWPPAAPKKTSCVCSNAPSPARCSNTSPRPARSTTTATYAPPDKPKTSP
jgi:transposase